MAYIAWLGKSRKTFSSRKELIHYIRDNPNLNLKVYEEDAFGNARELGTGEIFGLISESQASQGFRDNNNEEERETSQNRINQKPEDSQRERNEGQAYEQERLFGERNPPRRMPRQEYYDDREMLSNSITRIYGNNQNPEQAQAYSELQIHSKSTGFLAHFIIVLIILLALIALYIIIPLIMDNLVGTVTTPPVMP
ncbi:MAG TPA: hypothetical protein ENN46_00025 [Candidatus Woesearchaeota archaeon]|nr:hypothetical protein [Candidatus Woesearchaeota archaeon]